MPNTTMETPDWLRETGTILEELNEGVVAKGVMHSFVSTRGSLAPLLAQSLAVAELCQNPICFGGWA
jgi:hypothetical protein